MLSNELQARLKFLRDNPRVPAVMALAAGLVGIFLLALFGRRPRRDSVSDAISRGDLDALIREAARQGYEAGYAAATTEYAQRPAARSGISIFGMSPTELVSLVGLLISVARQAAEFVREQRESTSAD